jgi:hypothetical protein
VQRISLNGDGCSSSGHVLSELRGRLAQGTCAYSAAADPGRYGPDMCHCRSLGVQAMTTIEETQPAGVAAGPICDPVLAGMVGIVDEHDGQRGVALWVNGQVISGQIISSSAYLNKLISTFKIVNDDGIDDLEDMDSILSDTSGRSAGRTAAGSGVVVRGGRRARVRPLTPIWAISRSTVQRATSWPWDRSRSHILRAPRPATNRLARRSASISSPMSMMGSGAVSRRRSPRPGVN